MDTPLNLDRRVTRLPSMEGAPMTVERTEVVETYEDRKAAPFKAYEGAIFTRAKLEADDDLSEPTDLILSFEGLPDLHVSIGARFGDEAWFEIEVERPG